MILTCQVHHPRSREVCGAAAKQQLALIKIHACPALVRPHPVGDNGIDDGGDHHGVRDILPRHRSGGAEG